MRIFGRKNGKRRREMSFAGSWYESEPKKLSSQIKEFLSTASIALNSGQTSCNKVMEPESDIDKIERTLAIIVPHAGYIYSGSTQAFSYQAATATLSGANSFKRVFLLGPSHYRRFHGVALSRQMYFSTPLGDLEIDRELMEELSSYPQFEYMEDVHTKEHSLELQLPFLKYCMGETKLAPLIVGAFDGVDDVKIAGLILGRYLNQDDLIVVSSDFTHYGSRYHYSPFEGMNTEDLKERIKSLDLEALELISNRDLEGFFRFHQRTGCTICGFYPCMLLMSILPEESYCRILQYRTSIDSGFETDENSVSYVAAAFHCPATVSGWRKSALTRRSIHIDSEFQHKNDSHLNLNLNLSVDEKRSLLSLARAAIETYVREGRVITTADCDIEVTAIMLEHLGAFVTLFKHERSSFELAQTSKSLRGCLGYIWPIKSLLEAIIDNAIGACSSDHRFEPVAISELKDLQIEISILTPLQRIGQAADIEIGRHGIVLYSSGRQSVFLPHVAIEFGWSLEETLTQLCLKAGLPGDNWKRKASFDIFESIMFNENEFNENEFNENEFDEKNQGMQESAP